MEPPGRALHVHKAPGVDPSWFRGRRVVVLRLGLHLQPGLLQSDAALVVLLRVGEAELLGHGAVGHHLQPVLVRGAEQKVVMDITKVVLT